MPGPIAPIDHFDNDRRQILSQYVRKGLIPSLVLDGVTYLSYSDVYGDLLSAHFHGESDSPAAWDGTYYETWSPSRLVEAQWVKPRGFKDAVRRDMYPRICLRREFHFPPGRDGYLHCRMASYPRHVADRAAEMYQALYRQEGFVERFRQCNIVSNAVNLSECLGRFSDYEADWLENFAAEGWVQPYGSGPSTCYEMQELLYYNLFAAKVIESELEIDPAMPNTVMVMLDGTLTYSETQHPTVVRRKQAAQAGC